MLLTIDDITKKLLDTYEISISNSKAVHHVWDVMRDLPDDFYEDTIEGYEVQANGKVVQCPVDAYKVTNIEHMQEGRDWEYFKKTNRIELKKSYSGTLKLTYTQIPTDSDNYPYIPEQADKAILNYILSIQVQLKIFKAPVISTRSDKLLGWYEQKYLEELKNIRPKKFDLSPDKKKQLLRQ